ncbi:MAG: VWA domain-containing protein, partial [Planctomycetales bacterium]|nr:VWA domain-containing protein [Planctomycetales bacterium]
MRTSGKSLCWVMAAGLVLSATQASAAPTSRMGAYEHEGRTSYAISVTPTQDAAAPTKVDVVVLFDTSASQQGAYRETALASLESLLSSLRPADRVQVMAVDLDAREATPGFVAGQSAEALQAVAAIREQSPLGSTNLTRALLKASESLADSQAEQRVCIYVGDGVSMANLLDENELAGTVDALRKNRVSVSSYAIGPRVDAELLAVMANHTGGNLRVAEPLVRQDEAAGVTDQRAAAENFRQAKEAGQLLAEWTRGVVYWPKQVQWSQIPGQTYPASFPPLRSDRDTILIGETAESLPTNVDLSVAVEGPQGPAQFTWHMQPEELTDDQAFLAELVRRARRDEGMSLPTLGSAGLAEVARMLGAEVDQLTMLAERALAMGDRQSARRMVQTVLQVDPGNVQARTVQNVVEEDDLFGFGEAEETVEPAVPVDNEPLVDNAASDPSPFDEAPAGQTPAMALPAPERGVPAPQLGVPAEEATDGAIILQGDAPVGDLAPPAAFTPTFDDGGLLMQSELRGGSFLDEVEQERGVFRKMLQNDIQSTLVRARSQMGQDPQQAIQDLKLALENVRRTTDLDPGPRAELEDKLQIAIKEASRRLAIREEQERQRQAEAAAATEQRLLEASLSRRIDREKQLMDRFNSLMDERKYVEAEEVAAIVEEVDPDAVTPRVATLWSRHKRHEYLQQVTRAARHAAAWDAMYQVELSHIPMPDNPPIIYPDPAEWEELSIRRKKRYAAVDLKSQGKAETTIYETLRQPLRARLEYPQTPLNIVTQEIADVYSIPIVYDRAALEAVAISEETEVDINVSNITLRSALDLVLKQVEGLTYIVDNEVLLITTEEVAEERLTVKVYPVADLVLPIQNLGMGGMGGGMMGGMGGGMG